MMITKLPLFLTVKKQIRKALMNLILIEFFVLMILDIRFPSKTCENIINYAVDQKEANFVKFKANIFTFRLCRTLDIDLFTSIFLIFKSNIHLTSKCLLYSYFT